jgi:hypothetical protein
VLLGLVQWSGEESEGHNGFADPVEAQEVLEWRQEPQGRLRLLQRHYVAVEQAAKRDAAYG